MFSLPCETKKKKVLQCVGGSAMWLYVLFALMQNLDAMTATTNLNF